MARILLLAHLNCDHVLNLEQNLQSGKRLEYVDQGQRLGDWWCQYRYQLSLGAA